jgi:hypothetical protein
MKRQAHPEVTLYLANGSSRTRGVLAFQSDVYKVWHRQPRRLDGAMWGYVVRPMAVKVAYTRAGAPLLNLGPEPVQPTEEMCALAAAASRRLFRVIGASARETCVVRFENAQRSPWFCLLPPFDFWAHY